MTSLFLNMHIQQATETSVLNWVGADTYQFLTEKLTFDVIWLAYKKIHQKLKGACVAICIIMMFIR